MTLHYISVLLCFYRDLRPPVHPFFSLFEPDLKGRIIINLIQGYNKLRKVDFFYLKDLNR